MRNSSGAASLATSCAGCVFEALAGPQCGREVGAPRPTEAHEFGIGHEAMIRKGGCQRDR
jgi:hypothetical protein